MERILVAVDGSAGAGRAARFAAKLAKAMDAKLECVHVYDAPAASALGLQSLSKEELARRGGDIGRGSFEKADEAIGGVVVARHHLAIGHPVQQLVLRAQETHADLIVVGTRGRTNLEGLLLGSVSKRLLALSPCPVTVVP
jgi:nucleotide-binding universal stress UspA family protein